MAKKTNGLHTKVSLTIYSDAPEHYETMCKGVADLLYGIEETKSLNASAKKIAMAYSKAWKMLRQTEARLGITLLTRDGARGSTLTKEGKQLLDAYMTIHDELSELASRRFLELVS